ncbi:MAG: LamG-like jellyroll fold domain-containing protein, partial [Fimbriiglobus sp.]
MSAVLLLAAALTAAADPAAVSARFEGTPGTPLDGNNLVGKPVFSADVPGAFTYDPVTGKAAANTSSLKVAGKKGARSGVELPAPADLGGGFTLECFARPEGLVTDQQTAYPFLVKSRKSQAAADVRAVVWTTHPPHRYDWLQATVTPPGKDVREGRPLGDERYGGMTMSQKANPWRHHAVVVAADRKRATYFLNYTPLATATFDEPLVFDDGPLLAGGEPGGNGFHGFVDEVRLTPRPLEPHDFLHATPHNLRGVSFASPAGKLPRGAGYADI